MYNLFSTFSDRTRTIICPHKLIWLPKNWKIIQLDRRGNYGSIGCDVHSPANGIMVPMRQSRSLMLSCVLSSSHFGISSILFLLLLNLSICLSFILIIIYSYYSQNCIPFLNLYAFLFEIIIIFPFIPDLSSFSFPYQKSLNP